MLAPAGFASNVFEDVLGDKQTIVRGGLGLTVGAFGIAVAVQLHAQNIGGLSDVLHGGAAVAVVVAFGVFQDPVRVAQLPSLLVTPFDAGGRVRARDLDLDLGKLGGLGGIGGNGCGSG